MKELPPLDTCLFKPLIWKVIRIPILVRMRVTLFVDVARMVRVNFGLIIDLAA